VIGVAAETALERAVGVDVLAGGAQPEAAPSA
jgi:hypothetical protein